jgi:adenosylcobinamide-GDP ribazoletransferase
MAAAFAALRGTLGRERVRLLAAAQYFTRLRVPGGAGHSQEALAGAIRYLPLIGAFVGAAGGATYLAARLALPAGAAVALSMAATVIITGALHEDGLADAADGLGGGSSRERALAIMKDPHVGAFGATSLMLALLLKFNLLIALPTSRIPATLIAGHALSRLAAVAVMTTLPYLRDEERSRARPLVTGVSGASLPVAIVTGLAPLALAGEPGLIGAGGALAVGLLWRAYLLHRLGGYSGDCLGAAQQLCEIGFYLGVVAALPH